MIPAESLKPGSVYPSPREQVTATGKGPPEVESEIWAAEEAVAMMPVRVCPFLAARPEWLVGVLAEAAEDWWREGRLEAHRPQPVEPLPPPLLER